MCFINSHYDLIFDAKAQAELEYENITINQDFKTSAKETLQKFPPSKIQHSLQFFSSTRLKLSAEQQETQQRPLIPNSYPPPVKQQSESLDEWQPQSQENLQGSTQY